MQQQIEPPLQEQPSLLDIRDPDKNLPKPQKQQQDQKKQPCIWWRTLLIIISVLSISGTITLGTIYGLSQRIVTQANTNQSELPKSVSLGQLSPSFGQISMNSLQLQKDQWIALVYAVDLGKTQLIQPMTQSVMSQSQSQTNQVQYVQYISLENFLAAFNFSSEQVDSIVRLKEYFLDSINAIKKLVNEAKIVLNQPFLYVQEKKNLMDWMKLVEVKHLREIEIFYDITQNEFKPSLIAQTHTDRWKIGSNKLSSRKQSTSSNLESTQSPDYEQDPLFDNLFIRVMGNAIRQMKQVAVRSINFWNMDETQQLIKYQQSKASTINNKTEWKQTLINDCRTLESLKFRCSVDAVYRLVPQLTFQYIEANSDNYLMSNTLKIVLEKIVQK